MKGCLTLPFRLLGLLILILLGYLAWTYRADIRRQVHEWTADAADSSARGVAVRGGAGPAARRVEALLGSRTDSVTLSAEEVASLVDSLARIVAPGSIDSVRVTLADDDLSVRARVDTRSIPVSLGALGTMLRDRETIDAGGRVVFRQSGRAEWHLDRVRVRGIPVPGEVVERMIRRFDGSAQGNAIGFEIPATVRGLRVGPGGVTLYGAGAR